MGTTDQRISPEKVTVLLPVYNAAAYVKEAVESILAQTYRDFELLIVEDASTDDSLKIIQAITDDRIRIVRNPENLGITPSLNKGIRLARYALIARMDADDISHPWRLEKQVAYLQKHPDCAMLATWVRLIDHTGTYLRTEGINREFLYYTLNFECCIMHSTVMFRKTYLEAVGGYQKAYSEDFDLFWRISRRYKISAIDEPLVFYRLHDQNTNTVSRKTEYEIANIENLVRNIRCYTDGETPVPMEYLECYRNNFTRILAEGNLKKINSCLDLLDRISANMLVTENPNREADAIRYIWAFKKKYILTSLSLQLPVFKMLSLLSQQRAYRLAVKLTLKRVIKMIR